MTVGELIDQLLCFELTDKIEYLNCMIGTKGGYWDLAQSRMMGFRKFSLDHGEIDLKAVQTRAGKESA